MQLTYRAAQYVINVPTIETKQEQTIGTYRGVAIQFHAPSFAQCFQAVIPLKYRGASYIGFR